MTRTTFLGSVCAVLLLAGLGRAQAPASGRDPQAIAKRIDAEIAHGLKAKRIAAAPRTSDEEFLRRTYLDITGRIPTAKQAAEFLESQSSAKRFELIDALLANPNYGEHLGRTWRDWIAPAELPSEGNGGNQPIKATQDLGKWFAARFNAGDGWDKIVRAVLTADGSLKENPQGLFFSLVGDDQGRPKPGGAARAISSLFMGVQMQCAECHNDPFKDWKQTDFWGTAAFFRNVTWKFNGRYFESVGEAFENGKGGRSAPPPRDKQANGAIAIPKEAFKNVGQVVPAKFVGGAAYEAKESQPLRPVFTDWLTARDNPYFAKAFVNRMWWYFLSRGLVHPVDDIRDDNPPSHPETLKLLTEEFVASGFDVRHLVRCIANTEAYQRTSNLTKGQAEKIAELKEAFAIMPVRLLPADSLYDSLRLTLNDPALDLRSYDPKEAQRFGESSPVGTAYDEFVRLFGINEDDTTELTHGIPQFLALINHPRLRTGGKTPDDLVKANVTPEQAVETLYLGSLSRRPTAVEMDESKQFLQRASSPRRGYAGLVWTLVNRSEYVFVR